MKDRRVIPINLVRFPFPIWFNIHFRLVPIWFDFHFHLGSIPIWGSEIFQSKDIARRSFTNFGYGNLNNLLTNVSNPLFNRSLPHEPLLLHTDVWLSNERERAHFHYPIISLFVLWLTSSWTNVIHNFTLHFADILYTYRSQFSHIYTQHCSTSSVSIIWSSRTNSVQTCIPRIKISYINESRATF